MGQNIKKLEQDNAIKILGNSLNIYLVACGSYYKKKVKEEIIKAKCDAGIDQNKSAPNINKEGVLTVNAQKIDNLYQKIFNIWCDVVKYAEEYSTANRNFLRRGGKKPSINMVRLSLLRFMVTIGIQREQILENKNKYLLIEGKIIDSKVEELRGFEIEFKTWPSDIKEKLREVAFPTNENQIIRNNIGVRTQVPKVNRELKDELDKRAILRQYNEVDESQKTV